MQDFTDEALTLKSDMIEPIFDAKAQSRNDCESIVVNVFALHCFNAEAQAGLMYFSSLLILRTYALWLWVPFG